MPTFVIAFIISVVILVYFEQTILHGNYLVIGMMLSSLIAGLGFLILSPIIVLVLFPLLFNILLFLYYLIRFIFGIILYFLKADVEDLGEEFLRSDP